MRIMKKIALRFLAAALAFSLLSCGNAAVLNEDTSSDNSADTDGQTSLDEDISYEDIVYPDEEIPAVYISTKDNFQVTSKEEYSDCTFRIEYGERYSYIRDDFSDADGAAAEIRCRGNATYNNPEMKAKNKYSYKVKLSEKANILGMGESRHWYLINNWRDTSNLRHKLAYDMAAALGLAHTDSQWVTVYYNGEYRGLYLMTESIRVAEDRVETFNWEDFAEDIADEYADDYGLDSVVTYELEQAMKNDLGWITTQHLSVKLDGKRKIIDFSRYYDVDDLDLTSGYLIEYCSGMDTDGSKWRTDKDVPVVLDSPYMLHTNEKMYEYVKTLIQDFEDALFSPTFFNSKGKHYSDYLDVDSLVDYWMVWNMFCNNEFGARSLYYYIEDGKIVFGPIWDFDQTIGNVTTVATADAKGDYWVHDRKNAWFKEIFGDPWFTSLCQERWYDLRELTDDLISSVDVYFDYIGAEAEKCYERNGVRYYTIRQPNANNGHSLTPTEDYELIRKWLRNRVEWIDENFAKIDANVDSSGYIRSDKFSVSVSLDGKGLQKDTLTVYGAASDYVIHPDTSGKIKLSVTSKFNETVSIGTYLNGKTVLGTQRVNNKETVYFYIDTAKLDMTEGAVNVIYLCTYSNPLTTSVLIRVSSLDVPDADECVIEFGDEKIVVKKGTEITFPNITEKRDGFVKCGWTSGDDRLYAEGDTITVKKNMSFYVRWKRTDIFSLMDISPKEE